MTGLSPTKIVFDHQLRSILPAHRSSYASQWEEVMAARKRQAEVNAATKFRFGSRARPLSPLPVGAPVRVQDTKRKLWSQVGVIVAVGRYRPNRVKFVSGSVLWRNRWFLRPMVPATAEEEDGAAPGSPDWGDHHATGVTDPPDIIRKPAADTTPALYRSAQTQ